jgi:hypothetical protein
VSFFPIVRAWRWFLGSPSEPLSPSKTILWWEVRRIHYNVFLSLLACVALPIFFLEVMRSGYLKPGEDAEEPLALLAALVLANMAYTFGWMTEIVVNVVRRSSARRVGPALLRAGLIFSAVVVLAPAVYWSVVSLDRRAQAAAR